MADREGVDVSHGMCKNLLHEMTPENTARSGPDDRWRRCARCLSETRARIHAERNWMPEERAAARALRDEERFARALSYRLEPSTDLWRGTPHLMWTGSRSPDGYGSIRLPRGPMARVHRVMWERTRGPIPDGLEIDHLCRVRACAQPAHLEPVTGVENNRRGRAGAWNREKTHCPQGHPYDEANTYVHASGRRSCRECARIRQVPKNRARSAARAARRSAVA